MDCWMRCPTLIGAPLCILVWLGLSKLATQNFTQNVQQSIFVDPTVYHICFVTRHTTYPIYTLQQFQGAQCQMQISASYARVTETYTRTTPIVTNRQIRALDNDSQFLLGLLPELLAPLMSSKYPTWCCRLFFQRNLLLVSLPILPLTIVGSWLRPVIRCLRVFVLSPLICRFAYCRTTPMVGGNFFNQRTPLRFRGPLDSSLIPTFVVFGIIQR
ncbi:hypothetical protein BJY52DRAFT_138795 [Lactarius psammicola]|nr:hypothetical protein BJY52DRAFT_138795 [Lactarius psammicola]